MLTESQGGYTKLSADAVQSDLEHDSLTNTTPHEQQRHNFLRWRDRSSFRSFWVVHVLLISLYSAITFVTLMRNVYVEQQQQQRYTIDTNQLQYYSPAAEGVSFVSKTLPYDSMVGSKYVGNPSPELDSVWEDLFRGYHLRISEDTLTKLNRTSIKLADGSGHYWGSLEVFHHLHCLKTIRHYLAIDYYGEDNVRHDKPAGNLYPTHIEHCIERIREYLMCVPDLTVFTYDWVEGRAVEEGPMPNHAVQHTCVNWEHLQGWVDDHRFSIFDGLVRKVDGSIWPDRAGEKHVH